MHFGSYLHLSTYIYTQTQREMRAHAFIGTCTDLLIAILLTQRQVTTKMVVVATEKYELRHKMFS